MTAPDRVCIVGAGLAGGRAAMTLRQRGFDGEIVMVGEEDEPPYERPPLSKAYLGGETPKSKLWLQPPSGWRALGVEWRGSTRAVAIDRQRRRVTLGGGGEISYSKLVLTTGSTPSRLRVPGGELPGVMTLETIEDAERLRDLLNPHPRVVVVGGGFLGCELAAAATQAGCDVSLVEMGPALLPGLGAEAGRLARQLQEDQGCRVRLGVTVARLEGRSEVRSVHFDDGSNAPCELVLACVGSRPRVELGAAAGLALDSGLLVDRSCRTSDPSIFAAGDIASFWHPILRRRVRLEHWDNAQRQGAHLGEAIVGSRLGYHPIPYFWSEQYGRMIQQVGFAGPSHERVLLGRPESGNFSVLYLAGSKVVACLAVDRYRDLAAARRLIEAKVAVDRAALLDPEADLQALARAAMASGRHA
ncbi:MAG: NAD(P)/FAD-dependent oxidoreductase [Candidatus Dormibacteria bacterium]|jgi:3-phenylpropionate/trans-cinnamate dioxygenase ferredoxin reductase subunit